MLLVNIVTPDYHSVLPLIVYGMKIMRGKQNMCLYATLVAHEQFSAFPWSTSFPLQTSTGINGKDINQS